MFFLFFLWGCLKSFPCQNHTSPVTGLHHSKRRGEGDGAADEGGEGTRRRESCGCQLSGFHLFARKIDIRSPHAPSRVVSSCGPWRSSSPSQGRLVFPEKCMRLSSLWGWAPSESVTMGEGTAKKMNLSPSVPSPFHPWIASHMRLLNHLNLRELGG